MGLLEFNKLPINTLVGADWKTFKAITAGREIDPAYRGKYRLTKSSMPFAFHLGSIAGKAIQETVGRQAFGTRSGLYPRTLA